MKLTVPASVKRTVRPYLPDNVVHRIRPFIARDDPTPSLTQSEQLEAALAAIAEDPAASKAYLRAAEIHTRMGEDQQATDLLTVALERAGHDPEVVEAAAENAESEGDWTAAAFLWHRHAEMVMNPAASRTKQGLAQMELGDFDEAEATINDARALDPNLRGALNGLAFLAERRGNYDDALQAWGNIVDLQGEDQQALSGIASNLLRVGRREEGKAALDRALELSPFSVEVLRRQAELAQATCEFEEWKRHLDRLVQLKPNNPQFRAQRAIAANNLGDVFLFWRELDFTKDLYRREAWKGSISGMCGLIETLLKTGDWEEAQKLLPVLVARVHQVPTARVIKVATDALIWTGDRPGLVFLMQGIDTSLLTRKAAVEYANLLVVLERNEEAAEMIGRFPDLKGRRMQELRAWKAIYEGRRDDAVKTIDLLSFPHTMNHFRALEDADPGDLHPITCKLSPGSLADEVCVMTVCRNEMDRLPGWLAHYRSLGVRHFVAIDNASTDGTTEFLASQPDVHLWGATGFYRQTASGRRWLNSLMETVAAGAWCVIADADEFLVFPHHERGLGHLAGYLDSIGAETMFSLMLDMHGERIDSWNERTDGATMASLFPFFDTRTYLIGSRNAPYLSVSAGMRNLTLSKIMPEALLSKPSMIKGGRGIRHLTSHTTTPCTPADVTGAFLHYKFAVDPRPRSAFSSSKGVFARLLAQNLASTREVNLVSEHSERFEDVRQLIDRGIVRSSPAFDAFGTTF